jgi:hypothetical protein
LLSSENDAVFTFELSLKKEFKYSIIDSDLLTPVFVSVLVFVFDLDSEFDTMLIKAIIRIIAKHIFLYLINFIFQDYFIKLKNLVIK